MIAPQRQLETRHRRPATSTLHRARCGVAMGLAGEILPDKAVPVKPWKAWAAVGWMLLAASAYVTKMAGLWN